MKGIISCDWGTSVLRVRFVDVYEISVLAEIISDQGVSAIYNSWKESGMAEENRLLYYLKVIKNQVDILEKQLGFSLKDHHVVISGMASSNIGMMELPYKEIPFNVDGSDLNVEIIQGSENFRNEIFLISGAKTKNDVMRGEETQLAGCELIDDGSEQLFIFPGTHSKHILIENSRVFDFKTYMTGEFFSLLSKNSILSNNVEDSDYSIEGNALKNFEDGVAISLQQNLLHASFLTRTNELFNRNTKKENYFYLSGLLIGTEIKDLINCKTPITVVCNEVQRNYYFTAFRKMGNMGVRFQDVVAVTVNGQCRIYNNYKSG